MEIKSEIKMEMKAEKKKKMEETKANKPTNQIGFHGSNENIDGYHRCPLLMSFVFYYILKCNPLEETPRRRKISI